MHLQGPRGVAPNGAGDGWKITVGAEFRVETGCNYKETSPFGEKSEF